MLEFISYDDNGLLVLRLGHWNPRTANYISNGDCPVEFKDRYIIKKISKEELQNRFYDFGYNYSFETHTATKIIK